MSAKRTNWRNLLTLVSVTILVGVEFCATGWAAGWALGGLFQMSPIVSHGLELFFVLLALVALFYFVRAAHRTEPIRG